MLYRDNEEFKLMPLKASFDQHGEQHTAYVVEREEMRAYERMGHIKSLSFEEVTYPDDQLHRLEEVKNMPASQHQAVEEYVFEGKVQSGSMIELAKQRENLELSIIELSEMMMGVMF